MTSTTTGHSWGAGDNSTPNFQFCLKSEQEIRSCWNWREGWLGGSTARVSATVQCWVSLANCVPFQSSVATNSVGQIYWHEQHLSTWMAWISGFILVALVYRVDTDQVKQLSTTTAMPRRPKREHLLCGIMNYNWPSSGFELGSRGFNQTDSRPSSQRPLLRSSDIIGHRNILFRSTFSVSRPANFFSEDFHRFEAFDWSLLDWKKPSNRKKNRWTVPINFFRLPDQLKNNLKKAKKFKATKNKEFVFFSRFKFRWLEFKKIASSVKKFRFDCFIDFLQCPLPIN